MPKYVKSTQSLFIGFLMTLFIFVGCSNPTDTEEMVYESKEPDAKEVLTLDPEADIFQYKGLIYQTGIDWVEEVSLTKDQEIGEIKVKNEQDTHFEDGMSNKLAPGSKIFSSKEKGESMVLVESDGQLLKYLALSEG